jgi:drug/metabolite transporter (DMT)-like permease
VMTLVTMRATSVTALAVVLVVAMSRGLPGSTLAVGWRDLGLIAVIGVGDLLANQAFASASTRDAVSIVAVLGSLYPVMTVLLARFLHGERLGRAQTTGVTGALAGVVLIAAG